MNNLTFKTTILITELGKLNPSMKLPITYCYHDISILCRVPKTLTLLTKNVSCKIQKRTMLKNISKIPLTPALILEQKKIMLNKAIFLHYCNHFKELTLTQLLDDTTFIRTMHNQINRDPTLHSRAFQLAMEVTYAKRKFSQVELEEIYKNDFVIKDMFNINQGLCDQSTIYTCISTKILQNYFNFNKKDIIVNSTPIFLTKEKITPEIKQTMEHNKKLTDNNSPDLTVKERPYDFKDSKDICYNKNHIYVIDTELFKEKGPFMLNKLIQSLESSLLVSSKVSPETITYTKELVLILKKQKELNIQQQLENLNVHLNKYVMPKDFKCPYIVLKNKTTFENLNITESIQKQIDDVTLEKGHLDYLKAQQAIMSIINKFRDQNLRNTINQATKNSIQLLQIQEDVD
jgi:hypothetical protein